MYGFEQHIILSTAHRFNCKNLNFSYVSLLEISQKICKFDSFASCRCYWCGYPVNTGSVTSWWRYMWTARYLLFINVCSLHTIGKPYKWLEEAFVSDEVYLVGEHIAQVWIDLACPINMEPLGAARVWSTSGISSRNIQRIRYKRLIQSQI